MTRTQLPLPEELPKQSTTSRMAGTWLIAIVAVLVANFAAGTLLRSYSPNPTEHVVRKKWAILATLDASTDSLVLGDSTGNQGVDPALLSAELGGRWVNLSTVGNMLVVDSAWMLAEYIEKNGPPKRVLLVHVPDIWRRDAQPEVFATIPRPWGVWERDEPRLTFDAGDRVTALLVRSVPLYASNESLSSLLMEPWKAPERWPTLRDDGFMAVTRRSPNAIDVGIERQRLFYASTTPAVSQINEQAFRRLVALAEEHGFDLYYAIGTAHEDLVAVPGYVGYAQAIAQRLTELAGGSTRFHAVLTGSNGLPNALMSDHEHTTTEGAEAFTRRLIERLQPYVRALE